MEAYSRGSGLDVTGLDAALQLAHSRVPISSLTVLEPLPRWKSPLGAEDGAYDYAGTPPEAVGRKVRVSPHCKQVLFIRQRCATTHAVSSLPVDSLLGTIASSCQNERADAALLWLCTLAIRENSRDGPE
jgi:hypothetical protein